MIPLASSGRRVKRWFKLPWYPASIGNLAGVADRGQLMDRLVVLLAPLAALLPGGGPVDAPQDVPMAEVASPDASSRLFSPPPLDPIAGEDMEAFPVSDSFRAPVEHQVRIEQRITIRIAPRTSVPQRLMLELPERTRPHMSERRIGKCLPIAGIAGVQVGRDNRLMLFMRDRRTISLGLEKSCRARDFYAGFYVERSPDGQLCVDRDRLQSRSGANCALTRLRQLVAE